MPPVFSPDVFLSFAPGGHVEAWVRNHFGRELAEWVAVLTPRPTHVGLSGDEAVALDRARLMVAVLTPNYFHTKRCVAEWQAMHERERVLGLASVDNPRRLVTSVVFAGLESLPDRALARQWKDFREFSQPHAAFRDTVEYLAFSTRVKALAEELAESLPHIAPWKPAAEVGLH